VSTFESFPTFLTCPLTMSSLARVVKISDEPKALGRAKL